MIEAIMLFKAKLAMMVHGIKRRANQKEAVIAKWIINANNDKRLRKEKMLIIFFIVLLEPVKWSAA